MSHPYTIELLQFLFSEMARDAQMVDRLAEHMSRAAAAPAGATAAGGADEVADDDDDEAAVVCVPGQSVIESDFWLP
jgi:hypothetical protein